VALAGQETAAGSKSAIRLKTCPLRFRMISSTDRVCASGAFSQPSAFRALSLSRMLGHVPPQSAT
jgi:hypothetical protein